jgi:hypothetical protein
VSTTKAALYVILSVASQIVLSGCGLGLFEQNLCDMTPDGAVWLTVVRLVWAEQKFHALYGRYGGLIEMTNKLDGWPPEATSGRLGSYTISIELVQGGFVLGANPDRHQRNRVLAAFYGDQTGLITYEHSGKPAGFNSERMSGTPTHIETEHGRE